MTESDQSGDNKPHNKPGPKGIPKWGTITKQGIVVGRNGTVVPIDEIEHLASLGCTDRDIANYFNIHENSLRYNFKEYLTCGRHRLKITLRQAQIRVALEGNASLLVWLGKQLLNQNESGTASDEKRPLPWTDEVDDEVDDDVAEEDEVDVLDEQDADTEN
jgi:hypothetical protein